MRSVTRIEDMFLRCILINFYIIKPEDDRRTQLKYKNIYLESVN